MRSYEVKVDVTGSIDLGDPMEIAATVHLPDPGQAMAPAVIFASPGGGYARGYYDLTLPGREREPYSQARHHTAHGFAVVAYDYLGAGGSTRADPSALTLDRVAAASDAAIAKLAHGLISGSLHPGIPALAPFIRIGIGQSMGGAVTIAMQCRHATFAAISPLGFSVIQSLPPQPGDKSGTARAQRMNAAESMSVEDLRAASFDWVYPFFWEDVPADIVAADYGGGYPKRTIAPPWGSLTVPACVPRSKPTIVARGALSEEAANVRVPVLIVMGERDVCADPYAEPAMYRASNDVALFIAPQTAHMHNFHANRHLVWDRLTAFYAQVLSRRG